MKTITSILRRQARLADKAAATSAANAAALLAEVADIDRQLRGWRAFVAEFESGILAKYSGSWYGEDNAGPIGKATLRSDGRIDYEPGPYSQDYAAALWHYAGRHGLTLDVTGHRLPRDADELAAAAWLANGGAS